MASMSYVKSAAGEKVDSSEVMCILQMMYDKTQGSLSLQRYGVGCCIMRGALQVWCHAPGMLPQRHQVQMASHCRSSINHCLAAAAECLQQPCFHLSDPLLPPLLPYTMLLPHHPPLLPAAAAAAAAGSHLCVQPLHLLPDVVDDRLQRCAVAGLSLLVQVVHVQVVGDGHLAVGNGLHVR
jgi:hypothetical protein